MKKVNLAWHTKSLGVYGQAIIGDQPKLAFAWLGEQNKNAEFPVLSAFTNCRESFIAALWRTLTVDIPRNEWTASILYDRNIPIGKLLTPDLHVRMLIREVSKVSGPAAAFSDRAKQVLGIFEKYLGWRRTKIYQVGGVCPAKIASDCTGKIRVQDYVFDFSRKWARSPELLSLYLMIVKLCQFNIWDKFESVNDLQAVANLAKQIRGTEIIPYFTRTSQLWIPILDRVNELFMSQKIRSNYEDYEGTYGFHVFVANQNPRSVVSKRWAKIRKELKIKGIRSNDL